MTELDWHLSRSARLRYTTGALAYFAQGIPMGLLHIALPAWLITRGASAAQAAGFLSIIMLPWAFKLLTGPLMDHFEFLPMGKRRPWVLVAQLGMVISLLALGLVQDPIAQYGLLCAIGFAINAFTATQDVAIDGMSIDLVPLEQEGRLNAFMSFGKAVGWAVTSAITGTLLVVFGTQVTGIVCGLGAAGIFVFLLLVRERDGERLLPWTAGEASPQNEPPPSFLKVFTDINHVLWARASVMVIIIMFLDGMTDGYGRALMPVAAVKVFGFDTPQWSELNAVMGFCGALVALALGPLVDRFGAKRMMGLGILLIGLHAFTLAATQEFWSNTWFVKAMVSMWIMMIPISMVFSLSLAMSICSPGESATQFAIYMSVANMGSASGSAIYGAVSGFASWPQGYALMGLMGFLLLFAIMLLRSHGHPERVLEGAPADPSG